MLEPSNATEQGHASDVGKTVISSLVAESLPTQEPEAAAVEAGETQLGSVTHGVTETKKGTDDMEVEAAEAGSLGLAAKRVVVSLVGTAFFCFL